ncbi:MAG TPA: YifB family Mg chelatase-like AAA ATPase [Actinomycetes bacterium]|nr:YifB family Mg chelatase-like AAA ATPase [Actinomycetes bacterium]
MALARTRAVALTGVHGQVVDVEVDLAQGLPRTTIVGLPDTSLNEARERVRAAMANSGQAWPDTRVTINLSPASLHKHGSAFDVAVAVGLLAATEVVPAEQVASLVCIGELGLDGAVRAVRGVLPCVLAARSAGFRRVVVPAGNAAEAGLVPDVRVLPFGTLRELVEVLTGVAAEPVTAVPSDVALPPGEEDLSDVLGQQEGRWALEVAAAGGHHLLLHGPPGAGKTLLAERLPTILPPLEPDEALEVTAVHSVAGTLPPGHPLLTRAPFQAPHHSASAAALVGGGSGTARPGAVSLAHRGVLFLDEAPEFASEALEALRGPLETGTVVLARSRATVRLPARFQLVLAANPCPCGQAYGSGASCRCTPLQVRRYFGRLSGPLLDRVDLQVGVRDVPQAVLLDGSRGESSAEVAQRVQAARERSAARLSGTPWRLNAEVPGSYLRDHLPLDEQSRQVLHRAGGRLSARGLDRVLRVAWTVADLAGRDRPRPADVLSALTLRLGQLRGAA